MGQPLKFGVGVKGYLRFHHLDKMKHLIRSLVGIMFVFVRHFVVGLKIFAPKLIDLKSAFVNVKMNIALFKIGSTSLPNDRFGVQRFYLLPRAVADSLGVFLGRNEKNFKLVVMRFFVDLQNESSNASTVDNDAVGFTIGGIDATLDGFARYDFAILIYVVVAHAELLDRAVFKGPLIVKNKLLAIIRGKWGKSHFRVFHNYLQNEK